MLSARLARSAARARRVPARALDVPAAVNRLFYGGSASSSAPPLSQPLPGVPAASSVAAAPREAEPRVSTLPSGLRVVSLDDGSAASHVSVALEAGSRDEGDHNQGAAHFFNAMAFQSRGERSAFALTRAMGLLGGNVHGTPGREQMLFSGEALREYAPFLVKEVFAPMLYSRAFNEWELKKTVQRYQEDAEDALKAGDVDVLEVAHQAAYQRNTLGRPLLPSASAAGGITVQTLQDFADQRINPATMVVAGLGVDHAELCDMVSEYFPDANNKMQYQKPERAAAQYTGGDQRVHVAAEGAPAHVAVAFETVPWGHKDVIAMCVLQQLLGGGGSFSAGGPGKGMYTRLYENVLNKHGFVHSISSFNGVYGDSSIFGIWGEAAAADAGQLTSVLVAELKKTADKLGADELGRAKNQLKNSVLTALDSRVTLAEDIGRQLVQFGHVDSAATLAAKIDAVTEKDVLRVAANMLKTPVTVAGVGDLSYMPSYDQVARNF